MVVENLRIDVTPGGVPLVIHVSQYDAGLRQFVFTPYDKGVAMAKIAGATVAVEATKPDGYAVQHPCTYNNDGTITYTLREQLAAVEGQVWSKLTWRDSNGNILGAKAIVWAVDMAGIEDGAIVSDSDLPLIEQAAEFAGEYEQKVAEMIAEMQIVPGQVVIDGTLTVQGAAADAKKTGDELANLSSALNGKASTESVDALDDSLEDLWGVVESISPGLSPDAKAALLNCFAHVAWVDGDGRTYYDALEAALNDERVIRLTAVYTQTITVYDTDSLDVLKQDLVVTASWSDGAQTIVPDNEYVLTGTLTEGTSRIVVSYGGRITTFDVTVSTHILYQVKNRVLNGVDEYINTDLALFQTDRSFTILVDITENFDYSALTTSRYCTVFGLPNRDGIEGVVLNIARPSSTSQNVNHELWMFNHTGHVVWRTPVGESGHSRIRFAISRNAGETPFNYAASNNGAEISTFIENVRTATYQQYTDPISVGARLNVTTDLMTNFWAGTVHQFTVLDYAMSQTECNQFVLNG